MASFLFLKFCLYWIKHGQDVFFLIDQINWKKPENHPDKKIKGKESLGKKIFFSLWKKMKKKKIWSLYTWRVFILASTWLRHYLNDLCLWMCCFSFELMILQSDWSQCNMRSNLIGGERIKIKIKMGSKKGIKQKQQKNKKSKKKRKRRHAREFFLFVFLLFIIVIVTIEIINLHFFFWRWEKRKKK